MTTPTWMAATLLAAVVGLAGCSSPPNQDDMTEAILTATDDAPDIDLSEAQAACIAGILLESELSETTLSGLADDFANPEVLRAEQEAVRDLIEAASLTCAGSE